MNMMKLWMHAATTDEQRLLAKEAGTSRQYLYHLAAGADKKYTRDASPEMAAKIEEITGRMHKASSGRLPALYRTDLAVACRSCAFAAKCLGPIAVRSDFEIVTAEMLADTEGGSHD